VFNIPETIIVGNINKKKSTRAITLSISCW